MTKPRPIDKVKEPVIHELMAKIEELQLPNFTFSNFNNQASMMQNNGQNTMLSFG